jgi:hypothetical protein
MRKVRITKEQLESIVESTLNNGQSKEINELYGAETFLDPILWEAVVEAVKNFDWEMIKHLFSTYESLRALVGGLGGLGLISGIIAYAKSGFNKWNKEEQEKELRKMKRLDPAKYAKDAERFRETQGKG